MKAISIVVLILVSSAPGAQQPPAVRALPVDITPEQLKERMATAVGGQIAWAKLETLISRGSVEIQGLEGSGTVERFEKTPARTLQTMALPGGIEAASGCDGTTAWEKDSDGVRLLAGSELAEALVAECRFLAYVDLDRTYRQLTVAGKGSQNGQEFYLVDATRLDGVNEVLTVDATTYLVTLVVAQRLVDEKRVAVPMFVGEYRPVAGVMLPHLTRTRVGDVTLTLRWKSIEANRPVDDAIFLPPAGQ